jgi:hypothetical protein
LPDEHSLEFWKDCAKRYANNPAVLFDLYNEPIEAPWSVWRNGGQISEKVNGKEYFYQAVGLQTLLNAIRNEGAKNVVVAGGLGYASRLDCPESLLLRDPAGFGIIYANHFYPGWENEASWIKRLAPFASKHAVIVSEFGDDTYSAPMDTPGHRVGTVLNILQDQRLNWIAWCMHPSAHPCVIRDWTYAPTPEFGSLVKLALRDQAVPIPPRRKSAPDFRVFDGTLHDPWQNWSSATVDLASSDQAHSGNKSIKVTVNGDQVLQLGTVPFDGLAYKAIDFWAKSDQPMVLGIQAGIMDSMQPSVRLDPLGPGEWRHYQVSLDSLGVDGKQDIKSFRLRSVSGPGTFYLDDVILRGK